MADNDAVLTVPLTLEERADRAETMAGLVQQIRAIKAQAKAKAFEYREAVEALMERLEAHARVIMEGEESRRQMDLTFPQEQAARALHDVAAAACVCEDAGEDGIAVADPACPVHGVERRPDGTAKDSSERQVGGMEGEAQALEAAATEQLAAEMRADMGGVANTTETLPDPPEDFGRGPEGSDPEPVGEPVDVGAVEEPESVGRFRRGRRRASAGGTA